MQGADVDQDSILVSSITLIKMMREELATAQLRSAGAAISKPSRLAIAQLRSAGAAMRNHSSFSPLDTALLRGAGAALSNPSPCNQLHLITTRVFIDFVNASVPGNVVANNQGSIDMTDWSDTAYTVDTAAALRAIAANFPHFQLGHKTPNSGRTPFTTYFTVSFFFCGGPHEGETKYEVEFDAIDYGIRFEPFCTQEFLPSLSAEDHTRLMETAAMSENFRCFFLHLGVELGVHPVALQHVCRERCTVLSRLIAERNAADVASDCQLFSEPVNSVLKRLSSYR